MRLMAPIRRPLWMAASVGEGVLEVALNVVREMRAALVKVAVREPESPAPYPQRGPAPATPEPGLFDSTSRRSATPRPTKPRSPRRRGDGSRS